MKVARNPQTRLRTWFAPHHRGRKSRQRLAQAEPAVETVRRFGQVAPRILGLFDGMVGATDRPLECNDPVISCSGATFSRRAR